MCSLHDLFQCAVLIYLATSLDFTELNIIGIGSYQHNKIGTRLTLSYFFLNFEI